MSLLKKIYDIVKNEYGLNDGDLFKLKNGEDRKYFIKEYKIFSPIETPKGIKNINVDEIMIFFMIKSGITKC